MLKREQDLRPRPTPHATLPPARKSLGQHFLSDQNIARKIVRLAELQPGDAVVEIGPGRGILTKALLEVSARVTAIELDKALCVYLRTTLGDHQNFRLVEGDALAFEYGLMAEPFLIVANLPYYLSTPLLFRFLEERRRVGRMVLMLQAEVARRIAAAPGGKDYGVLSVAAQFSCEVRHAFRVPATCFQPRPQVDSSVVVVTPLASPRVQVSNEKRFFAVVRAGFAHRRKALVNSLRDEGFDPERARSALAHVGIAPGRRAETLTLEEFAALSNALG